MLISKKANVSLDIVIINIRERVYIRDYNYNILFFNSIKNSYLTLSSLNLLFTIFNKRNYRYLLTL